MNYKQLLLTILSEECAEVSQRCSKGIRFGLEEVQAGQDLNNAERIEQEFADLVGVYQLLMRDGHLDWPTDEAINNKKDKVFRYAQKSAALGQLTQ